MGLDGFKFRHLSMIVALGELGKIGVVGDMFGLSQPAMSRTLSELEQYAGHPLFIRHNRGVSLTPQGTVLVKHARVVLADAKRAEYEMAAAAAGKGGSVSFGTVMTPASEYIVPALKRIYKTNPTLDINLFVDSSDTLISNLLTGSLDFAICRIPVNMDPEWFDFVPLGKESLRLVVSTTHPLASKTLVSEDDLLNQDWILQPTGSPIRQVIDDLYHKRGLIARNVVSTSSVLLTILMVYQDQRVGIFSKSVAELLAQHGLLHALPFEKELSLAEFGLVKLRGREMPASAKPLFDLFKLNI